MGTTEAENERQTSLRPSVERPDGMAGGPAREDAGLRGFVRRRQTVRLRLTLWYLGILALILALLGAYVYLLQGHNLMEQVDSGLKAAAEMEAETSLEDFENPSAHSGGGLGSGDFVVRLVSANGEVLEGVGPFRRVPVWLPDGEDYGTLEGQRVRWRVYSRPVQTTGGQTAWLQAAQSLTATDQALASLLRQLLLGAPIALLLAGIGGHFLANRALAPIGRMTRTAQQITASDLSRRIDHHGPADELNELASTFDRMLERLEHAFARERRFVADVSHELRTPLTALKGRIQVTLSRRRTANEYEETLRELEQEVDRLTRLSTDLLLLARMDRGALPPRHEELELETLLEAVIDQVRPLAQARELELDGVLQPGLQLQGDADQLIRLFLNLLDNAIKYTDAGGRVTVSARRLNGKAEVEVADTGKGIAGQDVERIFDRFYRGEVSRARATGGYGLGLSIAYEIVRAHGGNIGVESEEGRGSTFTLTLPVGAKTPLSG